MEEKGRESGSGLTITKVILACHGRATEDERSTGKGSTFFVKLPQAVNLKP